MELIATYEWFALISIAVLKSLKVLVSIVRESVNICIVQERIDRLVMDGGSKSSKNWLHHHGLHCQGHILQRPTDHRLHDGSEIVVCRTGSFVGLSPDRGQCVEWAGSRHNAIIVFRLRFLNTLNIGQCVA